MPPVDLHSVFTIMVSPASFASSSADLPVVFAKDQPLSNALLHMGGPTFVSLVSFLISSTYAPFVPVPKMAPASASPA